MPFASRLKQIRQRSGKSLQELADAIAISKGHLWDLESGKSSNPSAELLRKLSDEFRVTVAWLVGEEPGDDEELRVMFRQLQELEPKDREIVQAIIDAQRRQKRTPGAE
jgi:transcriptional regulator with XRE-family HTH domain